MVTNNSFRIILGGVCLLTPIDAFTPFPSIGYRPDSYRNENESFQAMKSQVRSKLHTSSTLTLHLTRRQLQFWEDVEDGVKLRNGMESNDHTILPRIDEFIRSCKGEIPYPHSNLPYHQPCEVSYYHSLEEPFNFILFYRCSIFSVQMKRNIFQP